MIHHGDLFDVLPTIEAESIDACVTDPPYGIGFMGREWDTFKPENVRDAAAMKQRKDPEQLANLKNVYGRKRSPAQSPSQVEYNYTIDGLRGFQEWTERWAREVFRVLKPGAYIVVCGAPRSYHRMACGLEDAGFVVRDCFSWLFLSGFPKSLNFGCKCGGNAGPYDHVQGESAAQRNVRSVRGADVSTAVNARDEQSEILFDSLPEQGLSAHRKEDGFGVDEGREQPGVEGRQLYRAGEGLSDDQDAGSSEGTSERLRAGAHRRGGEDVGPPVEAERGSARCPRCGLLAAARGLGTALKPSNEPIIIARKPFKGTVENCFIQHGTAALNIEACRIGDADTRQVKRGGGNDFPHEDDAWTPKTIVAGSEFGRWPANTLLESPEAYPEIAPYLYVAKPSRKERDMGCEGLAEKTADAYAEHRGRRMDEPSRFDGKPLARGRNTHPTVKPVELMRWLVRLVTPIDGTVLDCFTGSGTTGMACVYEQRKFVGIEREAEYVEIAKRRIHAVAPLFSEAAS